MADVSDEVTTEVGPSFVSASAIVDAPPEAIFDYLRRPANHPEISGDHTVQAATSGPEQLSFGDSFGMKMRVGVPYWVRSKVVEFEPNREIAWCHFGGHRWRWQVEPAEGGKSRVTESFDMSTSRFAPALRVMGFPRAHAKNVAASVGNVVAHFKGAATP